MFYKTTIKDHIRVHPTLFDKPVKDAVLTEIKKRYDGYISKDIGIVVAVSDVNEIGEGKIIAGDGALHYEAKFELYTYRPEMQEIVVGQIKDIADFGAFITMGPIEGMIHVSQTMDDFVSFSKEKTLSGKDSKKILKVGDKCKARIIAVSFKDETNPKLGLTMRQPALGKLEWAEEEAERKKAKVETVEKAEKSPKKK